MMEKEAEVSLQERELEQRKSERGLMDRQVMIDNEMQKMSVGTRRLSNKKAERWLESQEMQHRSDMDWDVMSMPGPHTLMNSNWCNLERMLIGKIG